MSVTSFPFQIRFSSSRLSQRVEVTEGRLYPLKNRQSY